MRPLAQEHSLVGYAQRRALLDLTIVEMTEHLRWLKDHGAERGLLEATGCTPHHAQALIAFRNELVSKAEAGGPHLDAPRPVTRP